MAFIDYIDLKVIKKWPHVVVKRSSEATDMCVRHISGVPQHPEQPFIYKFW